MSPSRHVDVPTHVVAESPPTPVPDTPALTLGECADWLYELRAQRLALEAQVEELRQRETQTRAYLIAQLTAQGVTAVAGQTARAGLTTQQIGHVTDWAALTDHVIATRDLSLLQRRLNDAALRERWAAGETVPGVAPFPVTKVNLTKR